MTEAPDRRPRIAMVVQNRVSADTRVKRMAASAASAGCEVVVFGFVGREKRQETLIGNARVVKLHSPMRISAKKNAAVWPLKVTSYRSRDAFLLATDKRNLRRQRLAADLARWQRLANRPEKRPVRAFALHLAAVVTRSWARMREVTYRARRNAYQGKYPTLSFATLAQRALRVDLMRSYRKALAVLEDYELALAPEIDSFRPDLIHAHDCFTLAMVSNSVDRLRSQGHNVKWVYDAHEYVKGLEVLKDNRLRAVMELEQRYFRLSDRVITVTGELAARLQADYGLPEPPPVVMNAPALSAFDPAGAGLRRTLFLPADVPLLVYTGQVKPARDVHTLVEALAILPGVHLAVLTDARGAYIQSLKTLALDGGYAERLHFLPYVESHVVSSFIADATMGVIPLTHYGNAEVALPTKLFEYMHAGLPMAVSDTAAMKHLVERLGIGQVFRAEDPEDLASAVRDVLANRERYVRPLREDPSITRHYSWEEQERVLLGVYRELLGESVGTASSAGIPLEERPLETEVPADRLVQEGRRMSRPPTPGLPIPWSAPAAQ